MPYHVHGRAAQCRRHNTILEEARKAEVGDFQPNLRRWRITLARQLA